MGRFVIIILIMMMPAFRGNACCFAVKAISYIEKKGAWYHIYDENGKRIKVLSDNIGKLEGFSANFFIVSKSSWYYLYDENGKHYKTLSSSTGKIISVTGDTFVVRKGSWIYTYNKNGKQISSRAAQ